MFGTSVFITDVPRQFSVTDMVVPSNLARIRVHRRKYPESTMGDVQISIYGVWLK